jgi:hypothetical protein
LIEKERGYRLTTEIEIRENVVFFFNVIDEKDKDAWLMVVIKLILVIGCLSWFVGDGNDYVNDGGDEREARKNIFG